MDFSPSEEQRQLVATIRGFIIDELQPLEVQVEEAGHLAGDVAAAIRDKSRALGSEVVSGSVVSHERSYNCCAASTSSLWPSGGGSCEIKPHRW